MPEAASGGVIATRSSTNLVTPPGLLGYSHLVTPDEYQPPSGPVIKKFKLNLHMNEAQQAAFTKRLSAAMDALWEEFLVAAKKAGKPQKAVKFKGQMKKSDWVKPSAEDWFDKALQPFKEGASIELPYLTLSNKADYIDKKSGEVRMKRIRCTDATGETALDMKAIKLGMKSIVQAIIAPGIYASGTLNDGDPAISLSLQAVKVIKLEQYGGGAPVESISDEDMELAGAEVMDLSAYAQKEEAPREKPQRQSPEGDDYGADLDSEIPF